MLKEKLKRQLSTKACNKNLLTIALSLLVIMTGCIKKNKLHVTVSDELSKSFLNPPDSVKPSGYWWWLYNNVDKNSITRDLEEYHEKGIGAVLMVCTSNFGGAPEPDNYGPAFLSPEWKVLFKHALDEAHRLGMKVDVNIAPGWNMGGPWITPDKACRWYVQSEMTLSGPQKFSGKLPIPDANDGYYDKPNFGVVHQLNIPIEEADYRDAAVVAFRIPDNAKNGAKAIIRDDLWSKSGRSDHDVYTPATLLMAEPRSQWTASEDDSPIAVEDVIDLTSKLQLDGSLEWDVPKGDWVVVRTGHRMTGAQMVVPLPGQGGLENDFLDRAGVELMFESTGRVIAELGGEYTGNTLRAFAEDSFEAGFPNWTANMIKHFKKYRGYDPIPYLPVFRGYIVGSAEISDRFMHDYRKTIADCFADEHYGRFAELCAEYGLQLRSESAGPSWSSTVNIDGLKNLGRTDFPQGEFWRDEGFTLNGQNNVGKQTATAAHVYGKRIVSAEALTGGSHWSDSPEILKPDIDRAFCEGINCLVFHTLTAQRPQDGKPGYEYGAGTHLTPNITWWDQTMGSFVGYINRCQSMLQSGLFVADVLYYNGDWAPNLVEPKHVDPSLGKGYDYDVCNAEVLLTRLSVKDGRIILPDGMSYKLLVLPYETRMPVEIAEKLAELAKAGATIVGPRPESDPGLKDYPNSDRKVKAIANELWGNIDGKTVFERKIGQGRIIWGKTLRDILTSDGVLPDFEVSGESDTFIDFIHRATPEADFYFLVNRKNREENVTLTFRQDGLQPEMWDPVNGEQRDLPEFSIEDGRTTIPLQFGPNGSTFIVFRKPATKPQGNNVLTFKETQEITGQWHVSFDKEWFYPLDGLKGKEAEGQFVFEKLEDWTNRSEPAVKYFSGTANYSVEFMAPKEMSGNQEYYLDLGKVNVSASVRLNGKELGVVWCDPWRIDLGKALKKGLNKLEIEVVNRWPNRLIGDGKLPQEQRMTKTNLTGYYNPDVEHKLLPSGLLGPVVLMEKE